MLQEHCRGGLIECLPGGGIGGGEGLWTARGTAVQTDMWLWRPVGSTVAAVGGTVPGGVASSSTLRPKLAMIKALADEISALLADPGLEDVV